MTRELDRLLGDYADLLSLKRPGEGVGGDDVMEGNDGNVECRGRGDPAPWPERHGSHAKGIRNEIRSECTVDSGRWR